mgnify:FL=1
MLLKNENQIIRVLKSHGDKALVIDCIKRTMPKWVDGDSLSNYDDCGEDEMYERTDYPFGRELTQKEERIAQERFTMIAGVLPYIGNEQKRSQMIDFLAEHQSKQTIRKYLCLYLVYQDIDALAPPPKTERELTQDEKNMRWALNKFFYTKQKNSLMTAYTLMLKEKYCDQQGQLVAAYPTFDQFRYFYRKTKKMQQFYISRDGLKHYQRNNRPLLGDGVQQFAPAVGVGMLDSTICDIYLVDDGGKLVGRPVMTSCIDAFSGLCCGYSLGWEGGTYSLRGLMLNVIADKQEWCESHGVFIDDGEWDSKQMPGVLVTDMGSEYKGDTFSQVSELGVKVVNLPPYRPELKGMVEKFFDVVQNSYKKHLKGKGVIEPDYQERGAHDYRKDACLTLREFEQIVLHCIVYYNNSRVVDFPFTEEMLADGVKPNASSIFAWGKEQMGANFISVAPQKLIQTLLPRTTGKFTRKGLQVHGLRYKHDDYTEAFLSGGEVTVAYNPEDVTEVWLLDNGQYVPFVLIESRFNGKSLAAVQTMQKARKQTVNAAAADNLQAQINLAEHIQVIASQGRQTDVGIKNIRNTRKREQARTHIDFVKEGNICG